MASSKQQPAQRPNLGDMVEFTVNQKHARAQIVSFDPDTAAVVLLRVFPGLQHKHAGKMLTEAPADHLFRTWFPLRAAMRQGYAKIVGAADIPIGIRDDIGMHMDALAVIQYAERGIHEDKDEFDDPIGDFIGGV